MPPVFGPVIVVEDALVILRGQQRHVVLAVGDDEERHFGAGQHFLEDHARAGVAEALVDHRGVDRGFGRRSIRRDDDALAGGEAVGLDDERVAELARSNRRDAHRRPTCRRGSARSARRGAA